MDYRQNYDRTGFGPVRHRHRRGRRADRGPDPRRHPPRAALRPPAGRRRTGQAGRRQRRDGQLPPVQAHRRRPDRRGAAGPAPLLPAGRPPGRGRARGDRPDQPAAAGAQPAAVPRGRRARRGAHLLRPPGGPGGGGTPRHPAGPRPARQRPRTIEPNERWHTLRYHRGRSENPSGVRRQCRRGASRPSALRRGVYRLDPAPRAPERGAGRRDHRPAPLPRLDRARLGSPPPQRAHHRGGRGGPGRHLRIPGRLRPCAGRTGARPGRRGPA